MSLQTLTKTWCAAAGLLTFLPMVYVLEDLTWNMYTRPGYIVGLDNAEIIAQSIASVLAMVTATLLTLGFRRWALLVVGALQLSGLALYLVFLKQYLPSSRFSGALLLAVATSLVVISLRRRPWLLSAFLVLVGLGIASLSLYLLGLNPPGQLLVQAGAPLRLLVVAALVPASATATLILASFTAHLPLPLEARGGH